MGNPKHYERYWLEDEFGTVVGWTFGRRGLQGTRCSYGYRFRADTGFYRLDVEGYAIIVLPGTDDEEHSIYDEKPFDIEL